MAISFKDPILFNKPAVAGEENQVDQSDITPQLYVSRERHTFVNKIYDTTSPLRDASNKANPFLEGGNFSSTKYDNKTSPSNPILYNPY